MYFFFFNLFFYMTLLFGYFFFFSSRRRHTRSLCDWSSDVCSSDLARAQLGDRHLGVVGVGRWHVHEHLRAVDPRPCERVVRRLGELVPGQLLGEEAVDPRAAQDLRDLAVVAERVRGPELAAARAEALLQVALAVENLAHERLARRQVEVWLHPRAADDLPAALAHALAQPLVELGRVLLEPGVVLRRGGRE